MSFQSKDAYQKVRTAIVRGDLTPGERLVEKETCERFKVGRTPLREVFGQLEVEGYLDIVPNKGAIIKKMSVKDIEDIYDIIAILEGYATERAITHIKPRDRKILSKIQNDYRQAWRSRDYRSLLEKNALFHGYFPKVCGNIHLDSLIDTLRNRVQYRLIAALFLAPIEEYMSAHEEIIKAVCKMDKRQAGNAMRRHVLHVKKTSIGTLKKYPEL
jgi:DNA-binding GntR family transcriptional regulator